MRGTDSALLRQRFELKNTEAPHNQFDKPPKHNRKISVSDQFLISYAPQYEPELPLIGKSVLKGHRDARDWFVHQGDTTFDYGWLPA